MIKTFRGFIPDGGEQVIRLSTKNGKVGYKIHDLDIIGVDPTATTQESVVKVFKVTQPSVTTTIDFADGNLLAVAYRETYAAATSNEPATIIFDEEVFNQDIFITHEDSNNAGGCNYMLKLELMSLTDNAAAVSTLRDIRLNPQVGA
jgi:hypothetical protein